MQTFLPYKSFSKSAKCLDYKRLGKQRIEAKQILNCISKPNRWINHPAVRMWVGFEEALKHYYNAVLQEWIDRGYNNSMEFFAVDDGYLTPFWLGDERIHASHRANLIRKLPGHYSQFNWIEEPYNGYYFPVEPRSDYARQNNEYWSAKILNTTNLPLEI